MRNRDTSVGLAMLDVNYALYNLHDFLLGRSSVKKVQVDIRNELGNLCPDQKLRDMISPARLMAPSIQVAIHGMTAEQALSIAAATMAACKPSGTANNLLQKCQLLHDEAQYRVELARLVQFGRTSEQAAIAARYSMLHKLTGGYEFMTVESEASLGRMLRTLEEKLDEEGTDCMTKAVSQITSECERIMEVERARTAARSSQVVIRRGGWN